MVKYLHHPEIGYLSIVRFNCLIGQCCKDGLGLGYGCRSIPLDRTDLKRLFPRFSYF